MSKELRISGFARQFFGFYFVVVFGLLYSSFSNAACSWQSTGISSSVVTTDLVLNSSSYRMIANRSWYSDRNFPPGTLMAVDSFRMNGFVCTGLPELNTQKIDVVYIPPVGATPSGAGYLVAGHAPGVAMKVEFLNSAPHPEGIYLGTSTGAVVGSILTNRGGLPSFSIRLTLVKTGKFLDQNGMKQFEPVIWFPDGLGWFRYYAAGDPTRVSAAGNRLVMGDVLNPQRTDSYLGVAMMPICKLNSLGDMYLTSNAVVRLQPVSNSDFSGVGPISFSSRALPFKFHCERTVNTRAFVTFDASFPFNAGMDGVGMPDANSDIGVQILMNDTPVRFGGRSSELPWNKIRFDDGKYPMYHPLEGFLTRQGMYCFSDCGDTVSGPNWVDGGAAEGFNLGVEPIITFRYYQTSNQRPIPRKFAVPFTISLDWD